MREISVAEAEMVSGGNAVLQQIGINVISTYVYRVIEAIRQGPPPISMNSSEFGVVGPGSRWATDSYSPGAVNGADKQSDTFSADLNRRELDKALTF